MTDDAKNSTGIDYRTCRYGASRLRFRGPRRALDGPYVAALGGSETFGKFVDRPFPDLLEDILEEPVANFGVMQAGLTSILDDPDILDLASRARFTIIQVLGAQNMSNRFYSVHPRRNDRFLKASPSLQHLYPKLDFTEFNFTGHLVKTLEAEGGRAFTELVSELKLAWVYRMKSVLDSIRGETLLLWMSERRPEDTTDTTSDADPLFVDRDMLEELLPHAAGLIEAVPSPGARSEGLDTRRFAPGEEAAAQALPGPRFHAEVADALADVIGRPDASRRATSTPLVWTQAASGAA
ncbi:DUF6473 family protein [Kangsaoukella pontilimi]|uniref:DUF6473 family protein n=1 Tax=Kangsaoukella pontilimi TaxID=2691042 RepID=UPI0029CA54D4|nr:DUF6473 family protein [Kangsaoukella pontilimi]